MALDVGLKIDTVGGVVSGIASSSVMVKVWLEGEPLVALVGVPKVIMRVSSGVS